MLQPRFVLTKILMNDFLKLFCNIIFENVSEPTRESLYTIDPVIEEEIKVGMIRRQAHFPSHLGSGLGYKVYSAVKYVRV